MNQTPNHVVFHYNKYWSLYVFADVLFVCVRAWVFTWTLSKVFDINLSLLQAGCFSDLTWITVRLSIWSAHWIHIVSTAVYITHTPAKKNHVTCMFPSVAGLKKNWNSQWELNKIWTLKMGVLHVNILTKKYIFYIIKGFGWQNVRSFSAL